MSLRRSTGKHSESARLLSRMKKNEVDRSEGEMPIHSELRGGEPNIKDLALRNLV